MKILNVKFKTYLILIVFILICNLKMNNSSEIREKVTNSKIVLQNLNRIESSLIMSTNNINSTIKNTNSTFTIQNSLGLYSSNEKQYGYGTCSPELNCYLPYGICLNATTCMCMPDYANFANYNQSISNSFLNKLKNYNSNYLNPNTKFCSYKKKSIVVAGLLELFLPFALGHFYSGHTMIGSIKLVYNILIYIFGFFIYMKDSDEVNFNKNSASHGKDYYVEMMMICLFLCCLIPLWNLVDLFLFFTGNYKDGYGIDMA